MVTMLKFFIVFLVAMASPANAFETFLYQPLNRDEHITAEQWDSLLSELKKDGVRIFFIQWTSYGDADFGGAKGWLNRVAEQAARQGFGLIIGLHQDPDYFTNIQLTGEAKRYYLNKLTRMNFLQAELWGHWRKKPQFRGWYWPGELDDQNWQTPEKRELLEWQLVNLKRYLATDLLVSSFFSGNMPPKDFSGWMQHLQKLGMTVLVQDGAGTGLLNDWERGIYIKQLPCSVTLIYEIFRKVSSEDEAFKAVPLSSDAIKALDQGASSACYPTAAFSVQYLPRFHSMFFDKKFP